MSPTKKPLKRPVAEATIAESVMEEEGANQDYRDKRARNNLAVKKSREKNKQKINQTHERVSQLKEENQTLESNIKLLSKELKFLKEVFVAHAGSAHGMSVSDIGMHVDSLTDAASASSSSHESKQQQSNTTSDQISTSGDMT